MSQNYSGLFSSTSGSSNWFSDWSSLRNGSYRRLMKAYYGNVYGSDTSTSGTGASTSNVLDQILEERKHPTVSQEVEEANSSLTAGIPNLRNSVSVLQNKNTYTDSSDGKTSAADKVASAMKNYVSQYNSVISSAKKSTLSSQTSHVAAMMRSSEANADKLAEIGVTLNYDGTLQLDEKKLKAADLSKVQELFSSDDIMSYGSTVMSRLSFAGASSSAAAGTATTDTEQSNTADTGAATLKDAIETLTSDSLFEMFKDKDGSYQYDIDSILSSTKSFIDNYNNMFDNAKSSSNSGVISNLARIREKTAQYQDTLERFGISVDQKGNMSIDEDKFKAADMSEVQKFFKEYGSSIETNVSLVEYYMTTQANASNNYTQEGTYNVQGSNRFDDFI